MKIMQKRYWGKRHLIQHKHIATYFVQIITQELVSKQCPISYGVYNTE